MSVRLVFTAALEDVAAARPGQYLCAGGNEDWADEVNSSETLLQPPRPSLELCGKRVSRWSHSGFKRSFDCACALVAMPLLAPVFLAAALAVRVTSPGPIFFLQARMGRRGKTFSILKFRTLTHVAGATHQAITTPDNQCFTPVGGFLRQWKIDELPQLLNVLAGHMSLVGPRPKIPEYVLSPLPCRPGITGAATIAFAQEQTVLGCIPKHHIDAYYHQVVLPAKRRLDADYMAHATFRSDLELIVNSVLRRWEMSIMELALNIALLESKQELQFSLPAEASPQP